MIVVGCSKSVDISEGNAGMSMLERATVTLRGGFEGIDTRAFVDDELHLFWTADDRISVFEGKTYNQEYRYEGKTGDNKANFTPVASSGLHSGSDLDNPAYYSVYPYDKETLISQKNGLITYALPSVQQYADNSFGLGANTMVAVTKDMSDTYLSFKNVCGYVVFKLYGEGTVIKSVTLTSQAGESLAGNAVITASNGVAPAMEFKDDGSLVSTLTIYCGEGVALGATADEAKGFWFVVPPVTLSNGFAVTFTDINGVSITRTASGSRKVERNKVYRVPAIELLFQADFADKMELGVYSYDADNHKVTTLCQYNAGQDQFVTSANSFRIQNLDEGYLAGVTLPSSTITEGNSYSVSVMLYGIDGYADGTYTKTMVAEKVENDKVWLLEEGDSLGFIINTK